MKKKHQTRLSNYPQVVLKYILLDVHGVLTDGNERKRFLCKMEKIYNMNYDQHNSLWLSHIHDLDIGEEKASDFIKVVNKTFNTLISVKDYYVMFLEEIRINRRLIKKLRDTGFKVCIVSDSLPQISTGLSKIFGQDFRKYRKFYSFHLGAIKSEGMLKKVLIKLESTSPEKYLFIDDNLKNVEVAKQMGINAILFRTNKELFNELKKYN
jgi:HAD superfamily hydrolase (TIGR01509 family)